LPAFMVISLSLTAIDIAEHTFERIRIVSLSSSTTCSVSYGDVSSEIRYMTIGCTDSEPALKSTEHVEVFVATAEYHLVYMDAAPVAEPDDEV
jgi:hypothetical protein